jgi:low temperature requirement protein LtrA
MAEPVTAATAGHLLSLRVLRPMTARSPHEAHRAATPLELFFDLVFVVAIAQAAGSLHHAIAEAHALDGLVGYVMVFFALWWAWMNFTWFASAYDCDDVPYRLAVLVQMSGALIMAAGIKGMFESPSPNATVIAGYAVMRLALVGQWLRAAASDPSRRATALRYAGGIVALQAAWIGMIFVPQFWMAGFIVLITLELVLPAWAERTAPTTWHPHHIAERYGLLTLIVLGESIVAATAAVQAAISSGERFAPLVPIIIGGLLTVYSMWWLYFHRPVHDLLTGLRTAIVWGYGHYVVFAAAAAVGAGLAVAVDQATHHARIEAVGAGYAVAIPAFAYLLSLWLLHDRPEYARARGLRVLIAALILLAPLTGHGVPLTGVLLAALVAVKIVVGRSQPV